MMPAGRERRGCRGSVQTPAARDGDSEDEEGDEEMEEAKKRRRAGVAADIRGGGGGGSGIWATPAKRHRMAERCEGILPAVE